MLSLLLIGLLSICCAVFGVYRFTGDYTCRVVRGSKTLSKWCYNLAWLPSACVVVLVLGLAVMRTSLGGGGGGGYAGGYSGYDG
jgi:hypothetical protein